MPYIGNTPAEKYASYDVQHITTSATTSYVLDKNVANENEIRVVLNNIIQQPGASYAYTASANTLTLSVATTSNDTLYVVFTGKAVQTVTPPPSSVGLAQLNATGSPGNNTFLRGDNSWATPSDSVSYLVKISSDDTTPDFLNGKLVAGTGISLTEGSGGGDETLTIANTATTRENVNPVLTNGSMEVAQRSTSVSAIGNGDTGYHTCDRWRYEEGGSPTQEWTQSQDEIDSSDGGDAWANGFIRALKMDCTTASGSLAAGDYEVIEQRLEKQDCNIFKKGTSNSEKYTLTFWIKASKTGINIVELKDNSYTRTCSQSYTINVANTFEKKTVVFPADPTGGFTPNAQLGLSARWYLTAGTDYQSGSLQTTWGTQTSANRAVGQVNQADSTANVWNLTGAQLEVGEYTASTVPPFQSNTYGASLLRCQRYFRSYGGGDAYEQVAVGYTTGAQGSTFIDFSSPVMRSTPTTSFGTISNWIIYSNGAAYVCSGNPGASDPTPRNMKLITDHASGATAGFGGMLQANGTTSARLTLDAEL